MGEQSPGVSCFKEAALKTHLYEFVSKTKKLKCLCGWERTLKTTDQTVIDKKFVEHRTEASRLNKQ